MLDFFRWLQGFVEFLIIGRFPERFINIVTKKGLSIWSTRKKEGVLRARMYVRDYKRIRPLAKKSNVRLKIESKHGFPFFIRKYKTRVGVLIGIVVFSLTVCFMSCFVWSIDVVGLETVSYHNLMDTLKDNGLYIGTFKPSVSFTQISRSTMLDIEDIGWMSINVVGSHASVELKEKAKVPKVDDYHVPANVKATRDGLILSINTTQGEAFFGSGSAVVKDQLLVSGVVEDKLGGVNLVRANAEVLAQTTRDVTFKVDKNYPVMTFEKDKTLNVIELLGIKIPCGFVFADENESALRSDKNVLSFFDTDLPVVLISKRVYSKDVTTTSLKKQTAQDILKKRAMLYEGLVLEDCEVVSDDYKFYENDKQYILEVTYTCKEDIAYQQDIDTENVKIERVLPTEDSASP